MNKLTKEEMISVYSFLTGILTTADPSEPIASGFRKIHQMLSEEMQTALSKEEYEKAISDCAEELRLAEKYRNDFEPGLKALREAKAKNFPSRDQEPVL